MSQYILGHSSHAEGHINLVCVMQTIFGVMYWLRFIRVDDKNYGTYVTLLNVFIMTKQRVTRSTILAGTTSVGMRKLTQDITTKIAVGK